MSDSEIKVTQFCTLDFPEYGLSNKNKFLKSHLPDVFINFRSIST